MGSFKLLIQAYKYPPVQAVSVRRLHFLTHHFKALFGQIHVQTSSNALFFTKDHSYSPPAVEHVNIVTNDFRTFRANHGHSTSYLGAREKQSPLYPLFRRLYHSYPFILFTGDGGRTYINNAVRQASQLIQAEGITHLFSSYRPWSDHVICYRLKKKFPHLIWIADFRDLAVDPVRKDVWWPGLQRRFQASILRQADIVTTVSDGLARHFQELHPKVVVVRNGINKLPNHFLTAPMSPHFTVSYTGSIYPRLQSADLLFQLLRELIAEGEINPAHLALHYAGKDSGLWEDWTRKHSLHHLSTDHGMLDLNDAQALQKNSQLNLLLSWSAPNYGGIMTAKLASYLAAGRPVIALLNGPPDQELTTAIEGTGAGKVFSTQVAQHPEQLRAFLLDAYRSWTFGGALPWRCQPEKLKAYTWEAQIANLQEALGTAQKQIEATA